MTAWHRNWKIDPALLIIFLTLLKHYFTLLATHSLPDSNGVLDIIDTWYIFYVLIWVKNQYVAAVRRKLRDLLTKSQWFTVVRRHVFVIKFAINARRRYVKRRTLFPGSGLAKPRKNKKEHRILHRALQIAPLVETKREKYETNDL